MYAKRTLTKPAAGALKRIHHAVTAVHDPNATLAAIPEQMLAKGHLRFIQDHADVNSLYVNTRDGIEVDITVEPTFVDNVNEKRQSAARTELLRRAVGDYTSNNNWRPESPAGTHYPAFPAYANA